MKTYVLLHFEHKNDIIIIIKLHRATQYVQGDEVRESSVRCLLPSDFDTKKVHRMRPSVLLIVIFYEGESVRDRSHGFAVSTPGVAKAQWKNRGLLIWGCQSEPTGR